MKTTATLIQQALEQKAIDSMIAYERNLISEQKMGKALNDALQHYGNVEGHRSIVPVSYTHLTLPTKLEV